MSDPCNAKLWLPHGWFSTSVGPQPSRIARIKEAIGEDLFDESIFEKAAAGFYSQDLDEIKDVDGIADRLQATGLPFVLDHGAGTEYLAGLYIRDSSSTANTPFHVEMNARGDILLVAIVMDCKVNRKALKGRIADLEQVARAAKRFKNRCGAPPCLTFNSLVWDDE